MTSVETDYHLRAIVKTITGVEERKEYRRHYLNYHLAGDNHYRVDVALESQITEAGINIDTIRVFPPGL